MIRTSVLLMLLTIGISMRAQRSKLPQFSMVQPGGNVFKAKDLPNGKPIVIVYFSPECDHCQQLTRELTSQAAELTHASIVLVTYLPMNMVSAFIRQHHLEKYSNMYVGTEGNSFFLKSYYGLTQMPFTALYAKNGDLIQTFQQGSPVQELIRKVKQLR